MSEEKTTHNQENEVGAETNQNEQKIVDLEEKLSQTNDKLLRTLAELDNTRRRSREELEKTSKYAISGFVSDLVLVVENFFLACDNAPKEKIAADADIKHFDDAIEMTRKELMKILEKNQVKRLFPLNEKFDHNFHEAIAHIESDADEGTVVQVVQAGYVIGDRLIRPALVGVAKGK
jgi:molecular chaperone GrpE